MVRIVFEDKDNSPISRFIKCAYGEDDDRKRLDLTRRIWFAQSNSRLMSILKYNYSPDDAYLMYVDVCPDNSETVKLYYRLKEYIVSNNMQSVILLPIKCIEYYVLQYILSVYPDNVLGSSLNVTDYKRVTNSKNYEHYFKDLLGYLDRKCMHQKPAGDTLFYMGDCLCVNSEDDCQSLPRSDKSLRLVSMLPLYLNYEGTSDNLSYEDIKQVAVRLEEEFLDVQREMNTLGYCVS